MKVLHVYRTYFPDPPGGLQEAIRQIALASQSYGVESRIFTLSPERTSILLIRASSLEEIIVACFAVILAAILSNTLSVLLFTV